MEIFSVFIMHEFFGVCQDYKMRKQSLKACIYGLFSRFMYIVRQQGKDDNREIIRIQEKWHMIEHEQKMNAKEQAKKQDVSGRCLEDRKKKEEQRRNRRIIDSYDYLSSAASAQDCTGLIPAEPETEAERESYQDLYEYQYLPPKFPPEKKVF